MKILIVAVCYNAYNDTLKFLESIDIARIQVDLLDLRVVICDNSNNDYENNNLVKAEELREKINAFKFNYIKLDNVGYFPAFLAGKEFMDDLEGCDSWDYVFVSNVDLKFDKLFFEELFKCDIPIDVGVVAPSIISNQTLEDINPKIMLRPKKIKLVGLYYGFQILVFYRVYNWLSIVKAKINGYRLKKYSDNLHLSGDEMYAAHGSIMIFTKSYFKSGASIYYPRFLFGEEVFVAEEARLKGLKTVYFSELKIYDNEHGSTSREADRFISKEHVKSYKYLLENYFNIK